MNRIDVVEVGKMALSHKTNHFESNVDDQSMLTVHGSDRFTKITADLRCSDTRRVRRESERERERESRTACVGAGMEEN
jgi:hypothetical protein